METECYPCIPMQSASSSVQVKQEPRGSADADEDDLVDVVGTSTKHPPPPSLRKVVSHTSLLTAAAVKKEPLPTLIYTSSQQQQQQQLQISLPGGGGSGRLSQFANSQQGQTTTRSVNRITTRVRQDTHRHILIFVENL